MIEGQIKSQLVTLPPPNPPTDLIASALFLPLYGITPSYKGRKLRLVGQVLAFHPPTSLLLLTSFPSPSNPHSPSPTILVNISTPLLGQSPSSKDISSLSDSMFSRVPHVPTPTHSGKERNMINREMLNLNRGEWVNVGGWLEGDGERMVRKVKTSSSYLKPLPIILEAIHISNARPPPVDAVYRGDILTWDGIRNLAQNGEAIIVDGDEDEVDFEIIEMTPKPINRIQSKR